MESMIQRLEKFATEGMFGEINLLRVGPSSNEEKSAQFQSKLGFFEVDLVTRKGKVRKVPVVVKLQLDTASHETNLGLFQQFAIEVVTYQKVLPELGATDLGIHPKLYYGHATKGEDPDQDILILEDLRLQGFSVPKEVFLDSDHIHLALKRLGEFHGLSYKMKKSSSQQFKELTSLLPLKRIWDSEGYIEVSIVRGFQQDLQSSPGYSVLNRAYKKLTSKNSKEILEHLQQPEEPFAVIVHGDYLKNNMLYKYDENGKPSEVKLFDFATAMYSDPTVDLSVFLYMHTMNGREEHWNDYLKSYWEGVLSIIADPGFSFQQFLKNFASKAVYGFMISAFFLPIMQHPEEFIPFVKGFPDRSREERLEMARNFGGEHSTSAITSMVRHLLQEGYLEEYLLNIKQ